MLKRFFLLSTFLCYAFSATLFAQSVVPAPDQIFGFSPGDDYKMATYSEVESYIQLLAQRSERVQIQQIGTSALGKPLYVLFISSAENIARLEEYRQISASLARARIDEETAEKLAREGKAIVWIDGGMHATERAGGQMTPELAYKIATDESAEMKAIRDNVIVLLMPNLNPDGLDIVASWYKKHLGTPFETTSPAWLYHHYVGHDNNRDWFMNNQPESRAVSQVLYNEWYPQIVHNHHQTSPAWARIFLPPFSDPVNPNIHPGVTTGVNMVGTAMANRFAMKEMPGVVSDFQYSMWWNGGMRTAPYFHNMIGILTETAHATPTPRYYDPDSLPAMLGSRRSNTPTNGTDIFYPYPWKGGDSRFRDAVDYMITASMGILSIASDMRYRWLKNIFDMGQDAINAVNTNSTYAYVIPVQQWDLGEAYRLIRVLRKTGIEVHQATRTFTAGDSTYQAGSFVAFTAQAFSPMLFDLMEPQAYPDRRSESGAPQVPYDLAGWTLPIQMGVRVDRAPAPFEARLDPILAIDIYPAATPADNHTGFGYLLSYQENASTKAINLLLKQGIPVYWTSEELLIGDRVFPARSIVIENGEGVSETMREIGETMGLASTPLISRPDFPMQQIKRARIGLYKSWIANMDEGWTRWLLENYAFDVDTLHNVDIQHGTLSQYAAIILPSQGAERILNGHAQNTMPEEYTGGLGIEGTLALKQFIQEGGTLVTLDAASDFAIEQFGLPLRNVVKNVSAQQFFIPGSLIRTNVDTSHPLAAGMQPEIGASFQRSRAFETIQRSSIGEGGRESTEPAPTPDVQIVARYAEKDILMSGWALGEEQYIGGKAAVVNVPLGKGQIVLTGFRPQFRGQPGASYKLLFNALHAATIDSEPGDDPITTLPIPDNQ